MIGRYKNWNVPLIYVLAKNKKQTTYEEIFNKILEIEPDIRPKKIMIDFEMAALNAIDKYFPEANVHACFFHLLQNFWKKIQNVGLQTRYGNDIEFAVMLRMIPALAFVPICNVIQAYEAIVSLPFFEDSANNDANTEKQRLLNYFESNYIGSPSRTQGNRKSSRFPIQLWNMFETTILGKTIYRYFYKFMSYKQLFITNDNLNYLYRSIENQ